MPLAVVIAGAAGKMGRRLVALAAADPELRLAGAFELSGSEFLGQDAGELAGVGRLDLPLAAAPPKQADVLLEFTTPEGTRRIAELAAARGMALVSGTTGLGPAEEQALDAAARQVPVLWAPNTSTGVNVLAALVAEATRLLGPGWEVEIVEAHHDRKADAPSGTALGLAETVAAARGQQLEQVRVDGRKGRTGPRPPEEIGLHALRMGALVGEHTVYFAGGEEVLLLGHRAGSRDAFAAGALRAAKWLAGRKPGRYTMRQALGL